MAKTLWADEIRNHTALVPRTAAWYPKRGATFSDALAAVRFRLWNEMIFPPSPQIPESGNFPDDALIRLIQAVCFPA